MQTQNFGSYSRLMEWLCVAAFLIFSGCSINKFVIGQTGHILEYGLASMHEETDLVFAEVALAGNLKMIEALVKGDPGNPRLLTMAAEGFTSYALGFVEDQDAARASGFYLRARDYGLRALRTNVRLAKGLDGMLDDLRTALASVGRDQAPALFWTAIAWGNWVNLNKNSPAAIVELPLAMALMERSLALDPTFFHAGAHMFFGVILSSRPRMLGGDPEKGREHFEKNIQMTGGHFLMTKVYYAQYYAYQTQDRELFARLLGEVHDAADWPPDMSLMNLVAQRKAAVLLENIDEYF